MITEERIANMKKMLDLNLACETTTLPVFKSDLRDLADTLSALWRVCRAAEAYYKSNTGLSHICYESGTGKDLEDALAALREGKENL